jgi:two-component system, response regulator YesN
VAEIGYIDVANFVRKFKGYEGVTPGQYREKMRI